MKIQIVKLDSTCDAYEIRMTHFPLLNASLGPNTSGCIKKNGGTTKNNTNGFNLNDNLGKPDYQTAVKKY